MPINAARRGRGRGLDRGRRIVLHIDPVREPVDRVRRSENTWVLR
jgi:hypothetical protein